MEKINFFNPNQKLVFEEFTKNRYLIDQFYFTGGTALSLFYLHHRESEDLDFFSEIDFSNERAIEFMEGISRKIKLPARFTEREKARIFEFVKEEKVLLKVDFVHYPYKCLEKKVVIDRVRVDSLRDIATNKLLTINQRSDVKDYVDLYFLLKEFTLWDLIYGVEKKFRLELDLLLIAADFFKVAEFDFLPKMLVPLSITQLQDFFKARARELAKSFTE